MCSLLCARINREVVFAYSPARRGGEYAPTAAQPFAARRESREHGFLDVRLELAACRVDEGISTAASKLRILRFHVVLRRMISNLDITRQRADQFKGSIELISDGRR